MHLFRSTERLKNAARLRIAILDEYKFAFEKALLSEKYLSIVFTKSTVGAGSPDIEKEARLFLL